MSKISSKILMLSLVFISFFIISCEGNENLLNECEEGYHWNSSSESCERLYFSCKNDDTLCETGFICDTLSSTCIEGCREDSNCDNDRICINNKCENRSPKIKFSSNSLTFLENGVQRFEITNIGTSILTITKDVVINNSKFKFNENFSIPAGTQICPESASEDYCIIDDKVIPKKINVIINYLGTIENREEGNVVIYHDGGLESDHSFIYLTAATDVCYLKVKEEINFESVFITSSVTQEITLVNESNRNCIINKLGLESESRNVFTISYLDDYPQIEETIIIPTRANATEDLPNKYIFNINFAPPEESNYSANLKILATDSIWGENEKIIPILGVGSTTVFPVAKCDTLFGTDVEPSTKVKLDGSDSFAPDNTTLTYIWEKISAPVGSTSVPEEPTSVITGYYIDSAGEHKFKLTVTNESGLKSSCELTLNAIPSSALHIELFWDTNGDLGLHLKKFGTNDSAWGTDNDCFWQNCKSGLEWGAPGEIHNPRLDRDDLTGKGPENIDIDTPEITPEGEYYIVGVKNFSHRGNPIATVRIYCNGSAQFEYSMNLPIAGSSFWWVAGIEWLEEGCNIIPMNRVDNYPGASGSK